MHTTSGLGALPAVGVERPRGLATTTVVAVLFRPPALSLLERGWNGAASDGLHHTLLYVWLLCVHMKPFFLPVDIQHTPCLS